jgi:adenylate cyclase
MGLVAELRRRNVVRMAVLYVVAAWLIMQVAEVLIALAKLPDLIGPTTLILLAVGFPIAVIVSWFYEITPDGIRLEKDVDPGEPIMHVTGRRLDFLVISLLCAAVIIFAYDKWWIGPPPEKSIAVLAFENMSADPEQEYFSDGLADTVLHMLAQVRDLRVAARTSSFQFRGQSVDVAKIGEQLNVGTILEGSVQRSGDKIRVTVQLIDVSNGYHLWSGNFDRELEDVFAIQDEIATAVVLALKASLLGDSAQDLSRGQTDNVDAYTEYLLGINDLDVASAEELASAIKHLQEAVRLDPDYALAYAMLGYAYFASTDAGYIRSAEGLPAGRAAANHALDIFPESSMALTALGLVELWDGNRDTAGQLLRKAVDVGPNDTFALNGYAILLSMDGRVAESVKMYRQILRLDPLSASALNGLPHVLTRQRKFSEASEAIARYKSVFPMSGTVAWREAYNEWQQGNFAAAAASFTDAYMLDMKDPESKKDPESPFGAGLMYLEMDMPTDARQWFNRAVEIDAQHPVSLIAPIALNYYLLQNDEENVRLAREHLTNGTGRRMGSRIFALRALREHAATTGRYDSMLEVLENLYPYLFNDSPDDIVETRIGKYFAGIALMQSGDVERGMRLLQSNLEVPPYREKYNVVTLMDIGVRLWIGDTEGALDKVEEHSRSKYTSFLDKFELEHNSAFDPIRNEPAFIELLDEYRVNAAKQRQIIQAMNEDKPGQ